MNTFDKLSSLRVKLNMGDHNLRGGEKMIRTSIPVLTT